MVERTIIQIIPADGWYAVYNHEGNTLYHRLACWALIETSDTEDDVKYRYVAGLAGFDHLVACDNIRNFEGYQFGKEET